VLLASPASPPDGGAASKQIFTPTSGTCQGGAPARGRRALARAQAPRSGRLRTDWTHHREGSATSGPAGPRPPRWRAHPPNAREETGVASRRGGTVDPALGQPHGFARAGGRHDGIAPDSALLELLLGSLEAPRPGQEVPAQSVGAMANVVKRSAGRTAP